MHLDSYWLPMQADGDRADQLQRVGMIAVAEQINPEVKTGILARLALEVLIQPRPGIYTRFVGATVDDVTGDQLLPAFAYWALTRNVEQLKLMTKAMLLRFGFAQNIRKQGETDVKTIPDFIALRVLPLICRISPILYILLIAVDVLLILEVITRLIVAYKDPEDVDDNNLVISLLVCKHRLPTPTSLLALLIYTRLRPHKTPYQALAHYHRSESLGNPEIAELYKPLL